MSAVTEVLGTLALILVVTLAVIGAGALLNKRGLLPPIPDVGPGRQTAHRFPARSGRASGPVPQHPSLYSTHQLVAAFCGPQGWTAICVCGKRGERLPSRQACDAFQVVHQGIERAHDTKKTIRSGRLR